MVNSRLRLRLRQSKTEQRHEVRAPHGAVLELSTSSTFWWTLAWRSTCLSEDELGVETGAREA